MRSNRCLVGRDSKRHRRIDRHPSTSVVETVPPDSADLAHSVRAARLKVAFEGQPSSLTLATLLSTLTLAVLWPSGNRTMLLAWYATFAAVTFARVWLFRPRADGRRLAQESWRRFANAKPSVAKCEHDAKGQHQLLVRPGTGNPISPSNIRISAQVSFLAAGFRSRYDG